MGTLLQGMRASRMNLGLDESDRALLDRLAAQAWQEDPRPLSHPSYSDRRSDEFRGER